jgi:hypothetical protein
VTLFDTDAYLIENEPLNLESTIPVTEAGVRELLTPETSIRRQKGNERTALYSHACDEALIEFMEP